MSGRLGPLVVCCDAPPYPVVEACAKLGFCRPQDVRWCRMSHHLNGPGRVLGVPAWMVLLAYGSSPEKTCACGQALPKLEKYRFTFNTGRAMEYLLAQCRRCRTIFWEEG